MCLLPKTGECYDSGMKQTKLVRTFYYFFAACIILGALLVYKAWWDRYFRLRPELATAEPAVLSIDVPVDVALLWEESIIVSPSTGKISFPVGRGPLYCPKGETIAVISGSSGKKQIRMPGPGYFMAALDGQEGKWSYGDLWPGSNRIPSIQKPVFIAEGVAVLQGEPIGKFVPQPRQLRCVAYIDSATVAENFSAMEYLEIKRDPADLPFRAEIRAARDLGPALKVYLTLPFFPGEILLSRTMSFLHHTGQSSGVMIPESSVTLRGGQKVVFLVTGDRSRAVKVEGIPVSGKRFLVESGLSPGDLVVVSGSEAEEGEIRIW